MVSEIILFTVVAISIAYITLMLTGKAPSHQGAAAMYNLSDPDTTVLPFANCPWNGRPTSLRFAIFIETAPKTIAKVDCLETATPLTQFGPSCKDYTFKTCSCVGSSCTGCAVTSPYLSKVLYIGDALELWASGYTSANDKPLVPALLKIKTAQDTTKYFVESLSLPAIPLQRWTVVTIVKEGRRIDVYYGQKAVASKLCDNLPLSPSGSNWQAGGMNGWKGKIGLFTGTTKAKTQDDVNEDVKGLVNTRGIPFYLDQVNFSFDLTMPECIFGGCNDLPAVKPLNPFAVYNSSVQ
jgi:hypothetical protein